MILPQTVFAVVFLHAAFCDENNGARSESVEQRSVDKQKQGVAIPGFGNLGGVPGAGILPGQQPLVPAVGQPVVPGLPGTGIGAPVVPDVPPQPVVPGLPVLGGTNGALPGFGGLPGAVQPGVGGLSGVGVPGINSGNLPAAGAGGLAGVLGVTAAAGRK